MSIPAQAWGVASGPASITAGDATPTTIIPAQSGMVFSLGGEFTNGGSQECSLSLDDGATFPITAAPTSSIALPPGNYSSGLKAQGNGGIATGLSAVLWTGSVP